MKIARVLLLAVAVAAAGCDEDGGRRPPPTDIRFFHAAPNFATLAFLRETRPEAVLEFGGGLSASFDSGEYDFYLESSVAGSLQPVREVSLTRNLSDSLDYVFVAVAPGGLPQVLEYQLQAFDPAASTSRLTVIGAHPDSGAVDIYLQPPGTPLAGAVANGSVSFAGPAASFTVQPQTLRLFVTPAGDPNTVLFESIDLAFTAGTEAVFVVHATGNLLPNDLAVSRVAGTALRIGPADVDASLRVVQGVDDRLARDFVLDDNTTTPLFTAQAFGLLSDYVPITPAEHSLDLTPVGTPGTVERSADFTAAAASVYTAAFAGDTTNGVGSTVFLENSRRIVRQASLSFLNIAGLFNNVYIYIRPPGTDITTVLPNVELLAPAFTTRAFAPGDYEVTIQDSVTNAILAGPLPVTLAAEGIYGILLRNNADAVTIEFDYFYDFAP